MISPYKIKYNGLSSLDFDFFTELAFDSDSGNTNTFLSRENVETVHYDGRKTIHRTKYNESLEVSITFIKNNYGDVDDETNRRVLSWFTTSDKPGWLDIYKDDSEVVAYRLFGGWTSIEQYKLGNGRVVGYVCTFSSTAPYAFSRKLTYPEVYENIPEISNNDETNDYLEVTNGKTFTITCNTDEYNKPIYPKVTIKFSDTDIYFDVNEDLSQTYSTYDMIPHTVYKDKNGKLYVSLNKEGHKGEYVVQDLVSVIESPASFDLLNQYQYFSEDKTIKKCVGEAVDGDVAYSWKTIVKVGVSAKINDTIVTGASLGEQIIIDGENKIISGSNVNEARIIGDSFNWEWPTLAYGDNTITVTGNCNIKFEWLEPRKVGSL